MINDFLIGAPGGRGALRCPLSMQHENWAIVPILHLGEQPGGGSYFWGVFFWISAANLGQKTLLREGKKGRQKIIFIRSLALLGS